MWFYSQSKGELRLNDRLVGTGYAGHGKGVNNPAEQETHDVGPIPRGLYTIGPSFTHPRTGPMSMRLTPQPGTNTFGRDGFLMHGDNIAMNKTASNGCIIQNMKTRATVSASDDRTLKVVE
jgi:hypothetical protein